MPIIGSFGAGSGRGFGQREAEEPAFIVATGGTITTIGDYKIHAFTGPGTFCVSCAGNAAGSNALSNLLVVAGGGGGSFSDIGAGGGAGGLRNLSSVPVTVQGYPITVGGGGSGKTASGCPNQWAPGSNGSNSVAVGFTSTGGGAGGGGFPFSSYAGNPGGSGGGTGCGSGATEASGNSPPVSPPQGFPGGDAAGINTNGGGGGGSSAVGSPSSSGGNGTNVSPFFGTAPQPFYQSNQSNRGNTACGQFAGGGGGAADGPPGNAGSPGGVGGGGLGAGSTSSGGQPGTTNSGGGGGGGENIRNTPAGSGGSGIVLIKYKFQ